MQVTTRVAYPILNSEVLTIDNTTGGIALTATKYNTFDSTNGHAGAQTALLTIESAPIRYSVDPGVTVTDASTGVGHLLQAGDTLVLDGPSHIKNFRAVRHGSVSAVVQCSYFGA